MAIAQDGNASYASGTASPAACASLATTASDIHVVHIAAAGGTNLTITPPTGYVLLHRSNNGTSSAVASYLASSSLVAGPSFTLAGTGSGIWSIVGVALSGAATTVDTDSALQDAGGTNTAIAQGGTAITPTQANDRLLAFYSLQGAGNSNSVGTPPSGYTEVTPTGGAGGSTTTISRAYYLDNPALSSTAPTIIWNQGSAEPGFTYVAVKVSGAAVVAGKWPPEHFGALSF